jgi:transposase InsO family protein
VQVLEDVGEILRQGLSRSAALGCAAISSGTWRSWQRWRQAGSARLSPRGRPPHCASPDERRKAIDFLVELGSQVPLHALRQHLPMVPRAELADLRRRYQRVTRWRRDRFRGRLLWKRTGTVWSMDFTEPKEYIGGTDRWILAIRDLASGYQLTWLSFGQATAECVVRELAALFEEQGPPLVLKSDNGSQFIAEATLSLLREWRVEPLFNPPRRPAYNGGLERTHPILKGYTLAAAAAQGRPEGVMPEDLQRGRANANRFTRRFGNDGPTAEEAWRDRESISEELRVAFRQTVEAHRPGARAARGLAADAPLNHYQQAAIDRDAVRDALLAHDLLEIEPRRKRLERAKPTDPACAPPSLPALSHVPPCSVPLLPPCPPPEVMPCPVPEAVRCPPREATLCQPLEIIICAPASFSAAPRTVAAELAPAACSYLPWAEWAAADEKNSASRAPPLAASCRIPTASVRSSVDDGGPSGAGPAHGEPLPSKTLRRLITPLITWLRRAKFR